MKELLDLDLSFLSFSFFFFLLLSSSFCLDADSTPSLFMAIHAGDHCTGGNLSPLGGKLLLSLFDV